MEVVAWQVSFLDVLECHQDSLAFVVFNVAMMLWLWRLRLLLVLLLIVLLVLVSLLFSIGVIVITISVIIISTLTSSGNVSKRAIIKLLLKL